MGVARPGLLVGSGLMALIAVFFLSFAAHWFPVMLLLLGLVGAVLSLVGPPDAPAIQAQPPAGQPPQPARKADAELRDRLHELDQMLMDKVLSAAEHRRKRQALIDAWGQPRPGRPLGPA